MKKRKNLKEVIVLLIAAVLLFTSVAVTADTVEEEKVDPRFFRASSSDVVYGNDGQSAIDDVLFSQLPYEPYEQWIFMTSDADAGYRVHDNYFNVTGSIYDIHWWGLSLIYTGSGWQNCDPEEMCFEIIFWDSLLGNKICEYTQICPPAEPTGKFYSGFEMYYWETFLDPCCDQIPDGWVSIQSISSENDCWFLWAGSDDGDHYSYQQGAPDPEDFINDTAFELTGGCNSSIDVEKYVWDPVTNTWIDADTEDEALDLPICTDAKFKIVIHNDGCYPIYDINVTDIMNDSLEFIIADPDPDGSEYYPPNYYIYWYFSGLLNVGETIAINITAHVVGPECSIDSNYVEVEASSDSEPYTVSDEDYAYVHAFENDPPTSPIIDGSNEGKVGEESEFIFKTIDPEGHRVYYYVDWGDGNIEEWVGPYYSGYEVSIDHTWYIEGEYLIKAKAKDVFDLESDWTGFAVTIEPDLPPTAPTIDGQTSGRSGTEYEYTFNAEDPDGDYICYFIEWGDNTSTGWTAFYASGADVKIKHTWSEQGTYKIVAKAKNFDGLISPEGTLTVAMPRNKALIFNFNLLSWLFERFPNAFPILRCLLGL